MDKINAVVKSESLSSYLPSYTNKDENIVAKGDTKVFTHTKSRLLVHYNDHAIHKENVRKMGSFRDYDQPCGSSTPTLRTFQEKLMLEQQKKNGPTLLSQISPKQTRYNEPFDVEKFRRHSSREVSTSFLSQSIQTKFGSGRPKSARNVSVVKDISMDVQGPDKVPMLQNNHTTDIFKNSTSDETAGRASPTKIFSIRGHSMTQKNRKNVDFPFKTNTIPKTDIKKSEREIPQIRHDSAVASVLNGDQACPLESTTLNSELSNDNLDFHSMRENLQNSSSPIKKFDLIQSLVLRLSNQEPDERLTTVQNVVDNDVLGVSGESGNANTLEDLLWPVNIETPHPLQTIAAKLLNMLVSFKVGRDYFNKISMVKILTWRGTEQIHDLMADNLMSALKKLSLNDVQRGDMLQKGLLDWLISHMEMVEYSASTVHMECMTDLLRMLINMDNSTEFAFVNVPHFIVVLVKYLNKANEYVQVNVGHVLRTLFLSDTAIAIGNKINLHRIIRNLYEKASNSKLRNDLRYIYELFVKHRAGSSTRTELAASDDSRSTLLESTISFDGQELTREMDIEHEQLIREQNLTRKSEIVADDNSNEDGMELAENVAKLPELPRVKELPVQLCVEESTGEINRQTSDDKQENKSTAIDATNAEVLYSNFNSRLQQSSSLLSSGSQCASSECKESAIQILQMQSTQATEMERKSQKLIRKSTSKLHLKEIGENAPSKGLTDYSDLSSIAKDRDARNEILENDSFIDELCEKVLKKLTSKLAANIFCGSNCNTDDKNSCCTTVKANVQ